MQIITHCIIGSESFSQCLTCNCIALHNTDFSGGYQEDEDRDGAHALVEDHQNLVYDEDNDGNGTSNHCGPPGEEKVVCKVVHLPAAWFDVLQPGATASRAPIHILHAVNPTWVINIVPLM